MAWQQPIQAMTWQAHLVTIAHQEDAAQSLDAQRPQSTITALCLHIKQRRHWVHHRLERIVEHLHNMLVVSEALSTISHIHTADNWAMKDLLNTLVVAMAPNAFSNNVCDNDSLLILKLAD